MSLPDHWPAPPGICLHSHRSLQSVPSSAGVTRDHHHAGSDLRLGDDGKKRRSGTATTDKTHGQFSSKIFSESPVSSRTGRTCCLHPAPGVMSRVQVTKTLAKNKTGHLHHADDLPLPAANRSSRIKATAEWPSAYTVTPGLSEFERLAGSTGPPAENSDSASEFRRDSH